VVVVAAQGKEARDAPLLVPMRLADDAPELGERAALPDRSHAPVVVAEPARRALGPPPRQLVLLRSGEGGARELPVIGGKQQIGARHTLNTS